MSFPLFKKIGPYQPVPYNPMRSGGEARNFYNGKAGGHVPIVDIRRDENFIDKINDDSVPTILQPGEIVIPRKYVGVVERMLTGIGIYKNGKFI